MKEECDNSLSVACTGNEVSALSDDDELNGFVSSMKSKLGYRQTTYMTGRVVQVTHVRAHINFRTSRHFMVISALPSTILWKLCTN